MESYASKHFSAWPIQDPSQQRLQRSWWRKLSHLLYVTPFLPVWKRPPKGKEAFSAAWRSWRAAGRAGKWLGKTHQAQGGAKGQRPGEGQGVWWHYILVMLLGEGRLRNYEAHREAGEKVKNTAKIDSFMATSFIWHCFSASYFTTNLQPVNQKGMWLKWKEKTYI